eukprot:5001212-Prymnesium_polylepis.2
MGCLALRELTHFSETLREEAELLADGWDGWDVDDGGQPRTLPLALTAINASAWLWSLLQDGRLDRCFFVRGATLRTYRELFREIMCGFLRVWTQEAPASIAEFERVQTLYLSQVRRRLDGTADRITELYVSEKIA